jgi:hypothetical protein
MDHPSGDALWSGPVVVTGASEQRAIGVHGLEAGERDEALRRKGVPQGRRRARDRPVQHQHRCIQVGARCVVVPGVQEDRLWRVFHAFADDGDGRDVASAVEDAVGGRDHEPGVGDRRARADRTATNADEDLGDVTVQHVRLGEVRTGLDDGRRARKPGSRLAQWRGLGPPLRW